MNTIINEVIESIKAKLGDEYLVQANEVIKNNGLKRTGVTIKSPYRNVSPVVYIDDYVENGLSSDAIAATIIDIFNSSVPNDDFENLKNPEWIKKNLSLMMLNTELNRDILDEFPHKEFFDLSVFLCVKVKIDGSNGIFRLTNDHLKKYGIPFEEAYETALENLKKEYVLKSMRYILTELGAPSELIQDVDIENAMYCLTNKTRYYGAACLLLEDVVAGLAEILDSDLAIIPSSVSEILLIPINNRVGIIEDLFEMIENVNDTVVDAMEILSYHPYIYRRNSGFDSIVE